MSTYNMASTVMPSMIAGPSTATGGGAGIGAAALTAVVGFVFAFISVVTRYLPRFTALHTQ
jgi:hypothetical protein